MFSTVIALGSLALTIIATYVAVRTLRKVGSEKSADRFRNVREYLKEHISDLVKIAEQAQVHLRYDPELPLLTMRGWIPEKPIPLANVKLSFRKARLDESLEPARERVRHYWPKTVSGQMRTYHEAIGKLARPNLWFPGRSYRLLDVHTPGSGRTKGELELVFSEASYFDGIDTAEPLAYEMALQHMQAFRLLRPFWHLRRFRHWLGLRLAWPGRYRRWLSDAFSLHRRCALPGVNTLTLRVGGDKATFFLHSRDPQQVASMNTTHVVPAGEFQPHSKEVTTWRADLDLWHTIMREYAEEFLGTEDAAKPTGKVIDFDHDPPYACFNRALKEGALKVYLLGLGLEPITWKPEICTVCVWNRMSFDSIFRTMISHDEEGDLIVGEGHGVDFNEVNVKDYAERPEIDPAGCACLKLVWRWRSELGLPEQGS